MKPPKISIKDRIILAANEVAKIILNEFRPSASFDPEDKETAAARAAMLKAYCDTADRIIFGRVSPYLIAMDEHLQESSLSLATDGSPRLDLRIREQAALILRHIATDEVVNQRVGVLLEKQVFSGETSLASLLVTVKLRPKLKDFASEAAQLVEPGKRTADDVMLVTPKDIARLANLRFSSTPH